MSNIIARNAILVMQQRCWEDVMWCGITKGMTTKNQHHTPSLITIQGSARGGKGTLTKAFAEYLARDHMVQVIDQGMKFRALARLAIEAGIDVEDQKKLESFIQRDTTKDLMISMLERAYGLRKEQCEAEFYSVAINNASGMCGKLAVTHDVVIQVLLEEVRRFVRSKDYIIIDGRAMQKYGLLLEKEGVVKYTLAVDVVCSPMTAAKRVIGLPSNAQIEELTSEQKTTLLYTINDIDRRNSADARRPRDPSVPIPGAFEFNVLQDYTDGEIQEIADTIKKSRAVSIDNSFTRTKEQLTAPAIRLLHQIVYG